MTLSIPSGRFIFAMVVLLLTCFHSCDTVPTADDEQTMRDSTLLSFVIERPRSHGEWKDEITVYNSGRMEYNRLEGEEKLSSERILHEEEFRELEENLQYFYSFGETCHQYSEESVELYTLTFRGSQGSRTVLCDGSAPVEGNEHIKSLISLLRNLRTSLIGEKRFEGKLEFELVPVETVVGLDEPVRLRLAVANPTFEKVDIDFSSSGQLGFKIYNEGKVIYSSDAFANLGVLTTWTIPPASAEFKEFEWDHRSFDGSIYHDRKVDSGEYTVILFLKDGNSPWLSTDVTITEEGTGALQPRVMYNRYDDPSRFTYELNNRISKSFSFSFLSNKQVAFRIREYDTQTQNPGSVIYSDTTGDELNNHLTIDPFEEYTWNKTWDRRDSNGNAVPVGFYWLEMWLMDQDTDFRSGRRVYIRN